MYVHVHARIYSDDCYAYQYLAHPIPPITAYRYLTAAEDMRVRTVLSRPGELLCDGEGVGTELCVLQSLAVEYSAQRDVDHRILEVSVNSVIMHSCTCSKRYYIIIY